MIDNLKTSEIILTGSTGYIGSHYAEYCRNLGRTVFEITREHVINNDRSTLHYGESEIMTEFLGKLRNPIVVHLAGLVVSNHNSEQIKPLIQANLEFATQIFEVSAQLACPLVNAGSSWQFDGDGNLAAANLYAATKSASQEILRYYVKSKRIKATNLILYDTYGGRDQRRKLIPNLSESYSNGELFVVQGPQQPINLTHISDVLRAIDTMCNTLQSSQVSAPWYRAVRSRDTILVLQLVELIKSKIAPGLKYEVKEQGKLTSPKRLNEAVKIVENWEPQIDLVAGLQAVFKRGNR